MKYGVRDICDVVFKAKSTTKIGSKTFVAGQPVLYIDTAKTSTIEGAATTVYAQGGRGNTRLLAWEGEKTLTFTVEDALLSPVGFSILSGAGLFDGKKAEKEAHVHMTAVSSVDSSGIIDLKDHLRKDKDGNFEEQIDKTAPIFVMKTEKDGSLSGDIIKVAVESTNASQKLTATTTSEYKAGDTVFVDFYITKTAANVPEIQIDAENFGGYYYVEASTYFRKQIDGVDAPVEITFPNVKIQSNFTFQMASSGDPSTFTFTMDAFPGYTIFDQTKKVLCVMQIVEDAVAGTSVEHSVMAHKANLKINETDNDSATSESGEF